jgi:hypothetical protein
MESWDRDVEAWYVQVVRRDGCARQFTAALRRVEAVQNILGLSISIERRMEVDAEA